MNRSIKDAPWKEYLTTDESAQIEDLEGALELMKDAISKVSSHRERIRNRAAMRIKHLKKAKFL